MELKRLWQKENLLIILLQLCFQKKLAADEATYIFMWEMVKYLITENIAEKGEIANFVTKFCCCTVCDIWTHFCFPNIL